uniref:Gluconate kinase n=1 Tax=Thermogemmatispora argillosa TaxID=2045280 RepID=A0A455T545_9CHLR|nr:gluconate kinase [Thermogemmatispora argillosa]
MKGAGSRDSLAEPTVLAIDVGTSSVRAMLIDARGEAVPGTLTQHRYQLSTSAEGEASIDGDRLVELVARTIDGVLEAAGAIAHTITAVATDTFWHSLIAVDAQGQALLPLITWEDTRAHAAARELRAALDERAIHRRTGAPLQNSYWPARLRWLAQVQPALLKQSVQWLSFGEFLHRRLLGRAVCSLSMASGTGLLNLRSLNWDEELLEALAVRPEQFPPLGDLRDALQGLRPMYAQRWPLLKDVLWFPAVGDGAAANVGSGCVVSARYALTIGTSSALRVTVPAGNIEPPPGLWLYLLDARRALLGGALSEGGNLLSWLTELLRLPPLDEVEPLVSAVPPDSHGLTILPFLAGERSPGWHAEARMTISGLHLKLRPIDVLRAVMEALAYRLAIVYERLNTQPQLREGGTQIIGSGGALLRSPTLQQIIADVLGEPLYPLRVREAAVRGVALLALESLGLLPDVAQISPPLAAPVLPDRARGERYRQAIARQQQLYELLLTESDSA